jgi:hypothetical protein
MPNNTLRVDLSLGVVYMTHVDGLIDAIEDGALSAPTRKEAEAIANRLEIAAIHIRGELRNRRPWVNANAAPIEEQPI